MTSDGEAQRALSRIALAMVTMRVNTPPGHWIEETFGNAYFQLWEDARQVHGDDSTVDESLFLEVMNLAAGWLEQLADVTGRPVGAWLDDQRRAIDDLRFEGEDDGDDAGDPEA